MQASGCEFGVQQSPPPPPKRGKLWEGEGGGKNPPPPPPPEKGTWGVPQVPGVTTMILLIERQDRLATALRDVLHHERVARFATTRELDRSHPAVLRASLVLVDLDPLLLDGNEVSRLAVTLPPVRRLLVASQSVRAAQMLRTLNQLPHLTEWVDPACCELAQALSRCIRQEFWPSATMQLLTLPARSHVVRSAVIYAAIYGARSGLCSAELVASCAGITTRTLQNWFAYEGWPSPGESVNWLQVLHIVWMADQHRLRARAIAAELGYRNDRAVTDKVHGVTGKRLSLLLAEGGFPALLESFRVRVRSSG
jgi:hypothetical protein